MNRRVNRRAFLETTLGAGAAACAPSISAPGAPDAPSGPKAPWEAEWERTVAAANEEGKVSLLAQGSAGLREGIEAFQQAFPSIEVDAEGPAAMGTYAQKLLGERQAGIFSKDIGQMFTVTAFAVFRPAGVFDPIRPALILPELTDDSKWFGGFDFGFQDAAKEIAYGFSWEKQLTLWVNADLVKEGDLKTGRDLLDPRWKGKLVFAEPWTSGSTFVFATALRLKYGDDILKQIFVDQEPGISRDFRVITEDMVRGKYAIGTAEERRVEEMQEAGLRHNLKILDLPELTMIRENSIFMINKAPHPNAAKVFLNWFLTREGQFAWNKARNSNSRRTDVPPISSEKALAAGDEKRFVRANTEETQPKMTETQELLKKLLVR